MTKYLSLAPEYIDKALQNPVVGIYNLYAEKGTLLFELDQYEKSKEAFNEYYEIIKNFPNESNNQKWAKQMMYKCDLFINK